MPSARLGAAFSQKAWEWLACAAYSQEALVIPSCALFTGGRGLRSEDRESFFSMCFVVASGLRQYRVEHLAAADGRTGGTVVEWKCSLSPAAAEL